MNQRMIAGTVRVVAFAAAMLLLTMLVVTRSQAAFTASGLDTYAPFHFERQAKLPDGSSARVAFSLAFVTHKKMPEAVFFTCQQHAPQYFWKPEYQKHGARYWGLIMMKNPF